jgi:hypothetical protein
MCLLTPYFWLKAEKPKAIILEFLPAIVLHLIVLLLV